MLTKYITICIVIILALCINLSCGNKAGQAEDIVVKGNTLADQEKYDEAIKCYDQAIEIDPSCKSSWNNKGNLLADQKKYDEAIKCYDQALEIDPKYVQALYNKSTVLMDQGKFDIGRKCLEKVLQIDPNHKEASSLCD